MEYRKVLESKYNRVAWESMLYDIFQQHVEFYQSPAQVTVDKSVATQAYYIGKVTLSDNQLIAIYEVELTNTIHIEQTKVKIRNLLTSEWRSNGFAGAFMLCYQSDESVLRFSYVSEVYRFDNNKQLKKKATDTKRYTYLLGEGKRCRTAESQFEELKKSNLTLDDVTKAFSMEAVSDSFFKGYRERYADIVEYIIGKRFVKVKNKWKEEKRHEPNHAIYDQFLKFGNADKAVRDYIKKLMGRLVFLQFLQKKGWLGVPVSGQWGDGDKEFMQHLFANSQFKDNFIEKVLEPIFQDINTRRTNDVVSNLNVGINIRLPYLNGGLFEPDEADMTTVSLPKEKIQSILDFFGWYNFTIDENDPDDHEVGVDPEMLSRIFENLLEDNKDKGAFYTPKSKVEYMCRESLIAYLQTYTSNDERQAIRQFVLTHKKESLSCVSVDIDKLLRNVKICDPAIGSGAFPMGMLKELFLCRMALESDKGLRPADIKREIIQNNLYGVDIERGAVDIARLRFWLALVVDEETPETLPNLDFKIMQGNSLLEQYKGVDLSTATQRKKDGQMELFENMADIKRRELRKLLHLYYNCNNHEEKVAMHKQIADAVIAVMRENGYSKLDFKGIDVSSTPTFFLWHTWFSDVFDTGGFDIVITNPPYFRYQGNSSEEIPILRRQKFLEPAFGGKLNAYKVFMAFILNRLLKANAICCLIFQNSFLADRQAANLRKFVLGHTQLLRIDSYPERDNRKKRVFEDVKMSICITLLRNTATKKKFELNVWNDKDETSGIHAHLSEQDIKSISPDDYTIPRIDDTSLPIIKKMLSNGSKMKVTCNEGELNVTFHRKYFSDNSSLPIILKGAAIQRYYFTLDMSQGSIEYLKEKDYLHNCGSSDKAHHHEKDRIAMQGMTGANDRVRLIMCMVPRGYYLGNSCNYILPVEGVDTRLLLGFYNSKAANWFFRRFSTNSNVNGYEVENIPIPQFSENEMNKIVDLVNTIESMKTSKIATDSEEAEIDNIVYAAYGFTADEINIIEKS